MSSIVYLRNKSSGKVYVYANNRERDPDTGEVKNIRKCIGHLDEETGEVISNRPKKESKGSSVEIIGSSLLIKKISDDIGLTSVLRISFPTAWSKILDATEHIILKKGYLSSMEVKKTSRSGVEIGTPAQSLISSIDADGIEAFYKIWRKRNTGRSVNYLISSSLQNYDIYSTYVPGSDSYGNIHDLNIGFIIDSTTKIPLAMEKLSFPMTGASDVMDASARISWMGVTSTTFVSDKCLSSNESISELIATNNKFIIRLPNDGPFYDRAVASTKELMMDYRNYDRTSDYQFSKTIPAVFEKSKVYIHVYYSTDDAEKEMGSFLELIESCQQELLNDKWVHSHRNLYERFFIVSEENGQPKVDPNSNAIMSQNDKAGFIVLVSNTVKDASEAMELYKIRNWIEEIYGNLKNDMDQVDLKLYLTHRMDARLFIQFVSILLMNALDFKLKENGLSKDVTAEKAFASMKTLMSITNPYNNAISFSEPNGIAKKIMELYSINLKDIRKNNH